MQLKRADCSFLILPLELCSGKCKSSFLLLPSSSEMSLLTHTVYTLHSVPRSQIQAWIQTSGLAKFFVFTAYSPRTCLCFHSDASVQRELSAKELQERVLNAPLNRAVWRTNPWKNLSAYCYPSIWCAQEWMNIGRPMFPTGGEMGFTSPWVASSLLRWERVVLAPCYCNATQLWSSHTRQNEPSWLFYCNRWVLLSGLADGTDGIPLLGPTPDRLYIHLHVRKDLCRQTWAGSSWAIGWLTNRFLSDQSGYHQLHNFVETRQRVKKS